MHASRTRGLIILVATFALVAGTGIAIAGPGDCDGTGPHGRTFGRHGGPGGPGMGDGPGFGIHGMMRLLNRLDLSDSQQTQIEGILDAARPEIETIRDQMRDARHQFMTDLGTQFDEAAARAFAQSQAPMAEELLVKTLQTRAQVISVLTPEQQQQLEELRGCAQRLFGGPDGGPGMGHGMGKRGGFGGDCPRR